MLIVSKQIKKDFHRCELCLYVHLCAYLSRWYLSLHAWAHMEFIFACYLRLALMSEYDELMWGLKRLSWLDKLRCWLAYLRFPVRYLPGRWRHQEKRHSCHISWYCTTLSGEKTLSYIPIQLLGSIQLIAILAIAGKHHSCDFTWRHWSTSWKTKTVLALHSLRLCPTHLPREHELQRPYRFTAYT